MKQHKINLTLTCLVTAIVLTACGGGGGGGAPADTAPLPAPTTPPPTAGSSDLLPTAGSASTAELYSGSGIGIWSKANASPADVNVKIAIGNIVNKDVTLILTNTSNQDVAFPTLTLSSVMEPTINASVMSAANVSTTPDTVNHVPSHVEAFNRNGAKQVNLKPRSEVPLDGQLAASEITPTLAAVGDARSFNDGYGVARATTLQRQVTMPDGTLVQFWVENSEFAANKMTPALLDPMVAAFTQTGGIYQMIVDMGGPFWGPTTSASYINGNTKVIDLAFINIKNDGKGYGTIGYFYALNNFTKATFAQSNESLMLYLDTETIYLGGAGGQQSTKMAMAHEGMHLNNFYRRQVLMGGSYGFASWVEEMTAMAMEDVASNAIDPSYNNIRDVRVPSYFSTASYQCPLKEFVGLGSGQSCDSYSVSGSFGGYLMRQMGVPFYKTLLNEHETDSERALNNAIQAFHPTSNIGEELRRFAVATIPAAAASKAPSAQYSFPQRTDGAYTMVAIDPQRSRWARASYSTQGATLAAYSSYPVFRTSVTGNFVESVRVPPGTTLSVIVADQ